MEWIKIILPLVGVLIGWFLSESGKLIADKRLDKRKLRKMLFFLLELRYHFSKELSTELEIDKSLYCLKEKIADKLGVDKNDTEFSLGIDTLKPFLKQIIEKNKLQDDKYAYLAENADRILIELAEIYPILAYELSGRHNIKERLNNSDNYFNEVKSLAGDMPFDIEQWINPKLTKELLNDLDHSIQKIATEIGKKTLRITKHKVSQMDINSENTNDMEKFIDDYLDNIIQNIQQHNQM